MKRALSWALPIAILLLIGVWGLIRWQQPTAALQVMPAWPVVVPTKAVDIVMFASGPASEKVHLIRRGKHWKVQVGKGWKDADSQAVGDMLGTLAQMRPDRVVTRNPTHYAEMRVSNNADRITVKGKDGSVMLALLVGRPGPDLVSTYVRQVGKRTVLSVDRSLDWQVRRPADGWLKKKPHASKPAKISSAAEEKAVIKNKATGK